MLRRKIPFLMFSVGLISSIVIAGIAGGSEQSDNLYRDLSLFTEVVDLVENAYVDPVAPGVLIEGAFSGLAEAVDEYSYYVPPGSLEEYDLYRQSEGRGVGLVISKRLGYAYVVAVVDGSPADQAEIEAGDFIERIDGQLTSDMPVWKIDAALRFVTSEQVDLTIVRSGMSKRETFSFERSDWEMEGPVLSWDEDVAIVEIRQFDAETPDLLSAILDDIEARDGSKLILDVRGNAGGSVESAIETADLFLDGGRIVALEGRRIERQEWEASAGSIWDGEIVILIDSSTAGAAEIFASALSSNQRATTVGIDTYGMAGVQRFVELESGGGLYVTVGHYRTPRGDSIGAEGIRPDVAVSRASLILLQRSENESETDLILQRGLETIRG